MMKKIRVIRCAIIALITAFVANDPSHALKTKASALAVLDVVDEIVVIEMARGPSSLLMHLLGSLHRLIK
ncbi:hypothetical protein CRYUN_Cryun29cG0031700 [Craigia yunnanensis]